MENGHPYPSVSGREAVYPSELLLDCGVDVYELTHTAAVPEFNHTGDLGEQGIVLAPADIDAGLNLRAALPNEDGPAGDELAAERLHAEALRIRIATVFRAT